MLSRVHHDETAEIVAIIGMSEIVAFVCVSLEIAEVVEICVIDVVDVIALAAAATVAAMTLMFL